MRIYIAAPFFSTIQLDRVVWIEKILDDIGITYFSPRSFGSLRDMSASEKEEASAKIYLSNIENIIGCNTMLAVLDDKDTGTSFEMGFATAHKMRLREESLDYKIITISFLRKGLNVMLRECVDTHISGTGMFRHTMESFHKRLLVPRLLDDGEIE
jgi:nucleoside 2-deoxyribosyltransferase